jgi:hypothetical protein
VTISGRAAGRAFVLGSEGLGFLAILTAGVGFEVLSRLVGTPIGTLW